MQMPKWHVVVLPLSDTVHFAKALYDYDAQTEDELSFPEGAIIHILSKDNQEDDGFWEGEFNGSVGVFPAVLVEDLVAPNGKETQPGAETQVCTHRCMYLSLHVNAQCKNLYIAHFHMCFIDFFLETLSKM